MKKNSILVICLIFLLILFYIIFMIISHHTISKNYIASKNLQAKQTFEYIQSNESSFCDYCENNCISNSEIVYLFGETTNSFQHIIYANKYYDQDYNLSKKDINDKSIRYYWAIKIRDGNISEVWVYGSPLTQNLLKEYTYEEQIELIPIFEKEKYKYAIGYYKVTE